MMTFAFNIPALNASSMGIGETRKQTDRQTEQMHEAKDNSGRATGLGTGQYDPRRWLHYDGIVGHRAVLLSRIR